MSARTTEPTSTDVQLDIGGMTCASCAARIEKRLNKLDGVTATVNYATEKAKISVEDAHLTIDDLIAQVEGVGYTASVPRSAQNEAPNDPSSEVDPAKALRQRLTMSATLALPVEIGRASCRERVSYSV